MPSMMDNLRNRKVQHKSRAKDKSPEHSQKSNCNDFDQKNGNDSKLSVREGSNKNSVEEERVIKDYEEELIPAETNQQIFGRINFQIDIISISLFICGLVTRMYKLEEPRNIV